MSDRIVSFQVFKWDYSRWQRRFVSHFTQPNVKYAIAEVYKDLTERYVPYKTGALSRSGRILKDGTIRWGYNVQATPRKNRPDYAIFPYEGIGRGGKPMQYTTTVHPLATHHWDLQVYNRNRAYFIRQVTHKLKEIAKEEGW